MGFSYEQFVADARAAARQAQPDRAVKALLEQTLADPAAVAAAVPDREEDEIRLFEDDTVSVWSCRFQPQVVMPPHEHKMRVWLGVYRGVEVSTLYRRDPEGLTATATHATAPGQVLGLADDVIHAVTAEGPEPSEALHVYLGPLTDVERALFDWESGAAMPFTMERFSAMQRPR